MKSLLLRTFLLAAFIVPSQLQGWSVKGQTAPSQVTINVDATEAPRKILHASLHIPAKPGPLTLFYPKWIPGEHGPTGPITDLAGLKFKAGDKYLPWRRDEIDMYAFHLDWGQRDRRNARFSLASHN